MVSSLLSWNMNMAEWERDAAAQGQSESAKEEDNESHDDEGQQWRAGYLAAPQQPYPDHHHYAYGSYNTPINAPASAISDDAGAISFPRYQAFASFPYHHGIQTAGDAKLDGPDVKSTDSDHEEKKPAATALPVQHGGQLDRSERHRSSFDDSDDETAEWIEGYDPMVQRGVVPAYAPPPPPSHFVPHHASMPRDVVAMHPPDRHHDLHHHHHHVEHEARYNEHHHHHRSSSSRRVGGHHHQLVGNNHRAPSDEELRESQTPRSKLALKSWYDRFNELIEYMALHGDCNVPQKYEENPKLGVVSPCALRTLLAFVVVFVVVSRKLTTP
jgi:hypothetical protein